MLWARTICLFVCLCDLIAAEPSLDPVSACEATANEKAFGAQSVALLGRYSFREAGPRKGRWLDQEACGESPTHVAIRLVLDPQTAPKPPEQISIDEPALEKKLALVRQRTALGKFRFGSMDYDRWAVVIGRMERRGEEFQLTYRGDGAVLFLSDR